jgi:glycosyltransferase 2 family protein
MTATIGQDTGTAPARTRGLLRILLKTGISVALLLFLFSRVDGARLWSVARTASVAWLGAAVALYGVMVLLSAWRWGLLLQAQGIHLPFTRLTSSFLVATFFNNFLPSNIGGDVVRITDTAPAAGSKTLATTVVLMDRGIGLLGLVLLAAMAATAGPRAAADGAVDAGMLWAGLGLAAVVGTPVLLMPDKFAQLLQPLRRLHPEWVDERLARLTEALGRFREAPGALAGCFAGAVGVQAVLVAFYLAIAYSMQIPIGFTALAAIVPVSFLVQMLPISMNGFGVREATFGFYFARLGLPLESALLVSFVGAALILIVSVAGGITYLFRLRAAHSRMPSAQQHGTA